MTCTACGIPMYKQKSKPADRPAGSRRHEGHGLCHQCYQRPRRPQGDARDTAQARRSRDLARAGGLRPDCTMLDTGACETCPGCREAATNYESPLDAGPSHVSVAGVRRWLT